MGISRIILNHERTKDHEFHEKKLEGKIIYSKPVWPGAKRIWNYYWWGLPGQAQGPAPTVFLPLRFLFECCFSTSFQGWAGFMDEQTKRLIRRDRLKTIAPNSRPNFSRKKFLSQPPSILGRRHSKISYHISPRDSEMIYP